MTTVERRTRLLTVEAAGRRLGLSRSTVYRLIHSREITSVLIRGSRRISSAALDDYIRELERAQSVPTSTSGRDRLEGAR